MTEPQLFRRRALEIIAQRWPGWTLGGIAAIYPVPTGKPQKHCDHCGHFCDEHGKLNTKQGRVTVCPGDWIITSFDGEQYPCKHEVFVQVYEPLAQAEAAG